jgi:hypothetical protein
MISTEQLIKIYYNLSLIADMKEERFENLIEEISTLSDLEISLFISDLDQLEACIDSVEVTLKRKLSAQSKDKNISINEEINNKIILDPYYILIRSLEETNLENPNFFFKKNSKKRYIN